MKKLGDLFDFINGRGFKKTEWKDDGLPIIRIQNLNNNEAGFNYYQGKYDKKIEVNSGDLLFSWSGTVGTSFGPHIWFGEKGLLNQHIFKLGFKEKIHRDYAYYGLKYITEDIEKKVNGAVGLVHITKEKLNQFTIPFPSYSEQQNIVSILDEAFTAIATAKDNAGQNLKNARELFDSYLQNVFENKGENWVKETLETLLEKGWIESHLDGNHGGDYPKKEEFKREGVPYISANCIKGTEIDFSLAKHLSIEKAATFRKGVAKNNDVLFAHNATVGPVALLKTKEEKVILGTSLTYYRCNLNYILPEYLANYMRSKEFKNQYEIIMRQSTRNQVPITKQREFFHIVPPIEFQQNIIIKLEALLENCQRVEKIYQQKIEHLEELKKSVLRKAFSGELKTGKSKN